jgi:hypothetical protein
MKKSLTTAAVLVCLLVLGVLLFAASHWLLSLVGAIHPWDSEEDVGGKEFLVLLIAGFFTAWGIVAVRNWWKRNS